MKLTKFLLIFVIILVVLVSVPVPVLAQNATPTEWFLEFRYKIESCEPTTFSMTQTDWIVAMTIVTDKTVTLQTSPAYITKFFPCEGTTQIDNPPLFDYEIAASIYFDGVYQHEYDYYSLGWDGEFRLRKGEQLSVPMGEFSCDIGIPAPANPYNPEQELERLRNRLQPAHLDVDLIGDYQIPIKAILPLQIGSYRRDINLGGLVNLRFFFYGIILWRTFF